jgi:hypothetical protein
VAIMCHRQAIPANGTMYNPRRVSVSTPLPP